MALHAGNAVNELIEVLYPIADILSNLRMGNTPGVFGVAAETMPEGEHVNGNEDDWEDVEDEINIDIIQQDHIQSGNINTNTTTTQTNRQQSTSTHAGPGSNTNSSNQQANPLSGLLQALGGSGGQGNPLGGLLGSLANRGGTNGQAGNPLSGLLGALGAG
jgi:hypothetical protein